MRCKLQEEHAKPKSPPPSKDSSCSGGPITGLNVPIVGDYSNLAPSVKSSSKSIGEFHVNVTIDPITIDPKAFAESLAGRLDERYERRK
jgi:hypothetical protein